MEVDDRVGFGRVRLKHRLEPRDAKHVFDLWRDGADLQRPSAILWACQIARDQAEAPAVDEIDASEMKEDMRCVRQEPVETHLERLGLFTCDDPAAASDDRHIANAPTLQCERQKGPPDSVTRRV